MNTESDKTKTKTKTTLAEIFRDERMIVLGLLRQLIAVSTEQLTRALGDDQVDDPHVLRERVTEIVAQSHAQQRSLNNARICRRATASSRAPSTPPPPARLQGFARNGDYQGSYDRLSDLSRSSSAADTTISPELAKHLDLDGVAVDMHLDGTLWTLADEGKVHVFRCPGPEDAEAVSQT